MTVRPLNCIPEPIKCTRTAFACFHVGFCLEINAGSISIYHAAYFSCINNKCHQFNHELCKLCGYQTCSYKSSIYLCTTVTYKYYSLQLYTGGMKCANLNCL